MMSQQNGGAFLIPQVVPQQIRREETASRLGVTVRAPARRAIRLEVHLQIIRYLGRPRDTRIGSQNTRYTSRSSATLKEKAPHSAPCGALGSIFGLGIIGRSNRRPRHQRGGHRGYRRSKRH